MMPNQIINSEETRDARVKASSELWAKFSEWMARQGCTSLAEGIRTAMRQVTNFDPQSQENSQNTQIT